MINYRKEKVRYKVDKYGSLYLNLNKINENERPIIYIGGQIEHRNHILELTGFTTDKNHNAFTGSWFYDYPTINCDKINTNVMNFGDNLLEALKLANLESVDLITFSYGGLIGTYVSRSSLINKVIAIHPPLLGSPLANKELLYSHLNKLTLKERFLVSVVNLVINDNYGFQIDNKLGLNNPILQYCADLSKLIVVSSNIDLENEKNELVKSLYTIIKKITKKESDGVIINDAKLLFSLGITCIEDELINHFNARNVNHVTKSLELVRKRIK